MWLLVVLIYCIPGSQGRIYYTYKDKQVGTAKRDGSWAAPFEKISDCVKSLKLPGDTCQIRKGIYREEIDVTGLKGTSKAHIAIQGFGDERPILDGTVDLLPASGKWDKRADGVYYGKISQTIWQLFLGDLMMTNARWPNAKWSDKSMFDAKHRWAKVGKSTKIGNIVNRDHSLADSKLNMTGAIAILNIGSWNTFVAKVDNHLPGTNNFDYTDTFGKYHINWRVSQYYLEDKENLLDTHEEWFFNKDTMMLYFIPPKGMKFNPTTKLRGKTQTYAMTLSDSQFVDIKNIEFFGTTILGNSGVKRKTPYIDHIRFDSLNFKYPSASKRMLGKTDLSEGMVINGQRNAGSMKVWKTFEFFNNTFHGAGGVPLKYSGAYVSIENNLFEYNDWTSANMKKYGKGAATLLGTGINDTIIRNTFYYNGEAHGIKPGFMAHVKLNHVAGQCWGTQQNDGTGIQITAQKQKFAHVTDNWIRDSPKYGLRFDGDPPRMGEFGTIERNVAVRLESGGFQMKGDHHTMRSSLTFDTKGGVPRIAPKCSLCAFKYLRDETWYEMNIYSTVVNNMADVGHGCWKYDSNGKIIIPYQYWPIQGAVVKNNVIDMDIKDMMYDADNYDFRVLPRTPAAEARVGPYPFQAAKLVKYWIPGRQLYKATSPVPPNIARNEYKKEKKRVKVANRDALMWLNAYGRDTHLVYFGTNRENLKYIGYTEGDNNIMYLSYKVGSLNKDTTYFWRVDAYATQQVSGKKKVIVYEGDVWEFTTES